MTVHLLGRDSNGNRVLTAVACRFPSPVRRGELALELWPEPDAPLTTGRLRVALHRLRRLVPLVETGDLVGLDPSRATTDVHEARLAVSKAAAELDPRAERAVLQGLFPTLCEQLAPGTPGDRTQEAKLEWSVQAGTALARLASLAEAEGDSEAALAAAVSGLGHLPTDEELWSLRLRAARDLGLAPDSLRAFSAAKRRLADEGGQFSARLLEIEDSVRAGQRLGGPASGLTVNQADAVVSALGRALEAEPRAALAFLASSSFRPEVFRRPTDAIGLLRRVIEACPEPSEELERCQVRVIGALAFLDRDAEVIEESAKFLAGTVAPARRRIALLTRALPLFFCGRWGEALEGLSEAAEIADATGWPYDAWQCRCQHAYLRCLSGETDGAIDTVRAGLRHFEENPVPGDEQDVLAVKCNLAAALIQTDLPEDAADVLRPVCAAAARLGLPVTEALAATTLGAALAQSGHRAEACVHLARGLRAAYRSKSRRAMTVALGTASDALVHWDADAASQAAQDWAAGLASLGHVPWPACGQRMKRAGPGPHAPLSDVSLLAAVKRVVRQVHP